MIVVGGTACRRGAPSGEDRERAYRASNRGVALFEQFRYSEAAAAFREALQTDSSLAIARVNLSLALFYALDLEGAGREAEEAARLLPSAPQPPYLLGLIARAENRSADARRAFERVRQLDAGDVGTNVNLGQIYLEERQYQQAVAVLRAALAAEPYNVTAAYNLGLALTRGGDQDEGRKMLERAQALRATGYSVTYGSGYLEQGRYAEALASTGAEPGQVDADTPAVAFTPVVVTPAVPPRSIESPFGRRFAGRDLTPEGAEAIAAGLGGGVALLDIENDGDLDLFAASAAGQRLLRNDGRLAFTDVTAASGLAADRSDGIPVGCVAGDYDNDGQADLFVLRDGQSRLYRNDAGRFSDVTRQAGVPRYPFLPGAAAMADVDHDGDLDLAVAGLADVAATRRRGTDRLLVFPRDFDPAPIRLLRNNGNGTFADITADARLQAAGHAVALVPTDFDNRRDVDLLVVNHDAAPLLFQNLRDGTFRDVAADVGLAAAVGSTAETAAVTAADVNKDDFPDFFFAGASGGIFALSDGRGRFTAAAAPEGVGASFAAQFLDYDSDGVLDVATWSGDGPRLFRNLGLSWNDVTDRALPGAAAGTLHPRSARGLAVGDVDGDGDSDLVSGEAGSIGVWNSGGSAGNPHALRVELRGRIGNRLGIGSKIELRAGSLKGRFETSAATPSVAPADIVFGLGSRGEADAVRVQWPSGILQSERLPPASGGPAAFPIRLTIEELNRKPSSCPFLFAWNGERFEFLTDFIGGGEMGYLEAPGRHNIPDSLEYVRIRENELRAKEGRFELRVTNELEETLFLDRVQLIAIAHGTTLEVYPNEGLTHPPKPFRLFVVTGERVPRAVDDHGHDVTDRIARIDRRYPDDFALERFRGYAAPHGLTLDVAPVGDAPVLLLTGWTDYAFSSDNVAAHQAGLSLMPPSLQIRDVSGRWRTAVADVGIPVGRPQTIPIDLAGHLRPGEREVRILTNMRIYWDRVAVATAAPEASLRTTALNPLSATLRARGFSAEIRPDGLEPAAFDYDQATAVSPWKAMPGRFTRFGDVRALLSHADDMFVIGAPGDEVAIAFDAGAISRPPEGWTRTFLLLTDGYSKEMDINSASPDAVEPLPFHAMSRYPYRWPERYPDTRAHRQYRETYNTRVVARTLPSIDSLANQRAR